MSSEDRDAEAPQADESAPMAKVTAEDSSSSDESDSGRYTISQTTFDALTARGFSDNAIKKSVVAGCINEATCAKWIQMHEGHPELDTALEDGVNVVIKAKRVLTEAEREVKLRELQERVRRTKEEEKLELQRKERERLEMGRNMIRMKKELEDVRRKMNMEEVRRENAANVEARRRIRVQIAADRLERRGHTKAEALALAEKEFEEATTAARAEAAARLAKLQEQQASAQTTTPTSGGTWNLSTLTAASSMPNKLAEWFAGDAPTCPQALVDKIRKREAADKTGECVRTLRLILGNIVTEPFDTKKRTLRVSTKAFRDTILPVEEAVQLLRWCGFALSTDAASSPSLCLSTVVMRRLYQVLALLDHEG
ncbi:hypothetical protein LSCM1_00014 [Leishmania martiniquensis]|uniref:PUB domain-containing protein n=1 Tax=Leishmania martiniquensis TaxID=1580590 RepID=A0A836GTG6_9TRYP|nr:hypothetical protein LSCM1_00014 [Leishmania martiniquensis]